MKCKWHKQFIVNKKIKDECQNTDIVYNTAWIGFARCPYTNYTEKDCPYMEVSNDNA
jgi:hypothetical protein